MSGSIFGNYFRITTWGESHGPAIGVVIDGCPAGLALSAEDIQPFLDRRKPGQSKYTTKRNENEQIQILSGIFEGKTTGTPISLIVYNQDQRSKDYKNLAATYRPGHADYTFDAKYGFRDYRGGGRSSGRETIGRVAAGAIASKILHTLGITIQAYTKAIGPYSIAPSDYHFDEINRNPLYMPNAQTAKKAEEFLSDCMEQQDSAGGVIECRIEHLPVGIGEPVFSKLDATLAKAIMSIGAVKAVEIGDGFSVSSALGSQNNDAFCLDKNGHISKSTNHSGGILGGMSDGDTVILRAAFKPTPSIAKVQNTVTKQGEATTLSIIGRHDPVIVPRAVVVVESMAALTVLDLMFSNMHSNLDGILNFYKK